VDTVGYIWLLISLSQRRQGPGPSGSWTHWTRLLGPGPWVLARTRLDPKGLGKVCSEEEKKDLLSYLRE